MSDAWWRESVLYQVYPRSFADGNGDGIGDLPGIVDRLDHLEWLGVDGLWLNPIHPSPNVDWGYDVSDYLDVHPDLGTLADVDRLVAESARRGIRVLLDLVPNHTSDRHPWFRERPELYVWANGVPNNWHSFFGGSAWTLDPARGRHYLHNFAAGQPDLDWWSPEVRAEFERILGFWLDRGVAGFRIDVANALIKDRELRDEPDPEAPYDRVYALNRPETHEILQGWRALCESYVPPRILVGEAYVLDVPAWARFYGSGDDELNLAFDFALVHSPFEADPMRRVVSATEAELPDPAVPCWIGSNHDVGRFTTRWCGGDERLARCALLLLLTLRGTPCLYYGDELALEDGDVPPERILDIADPPRDPCRTPMPWSRAGEWSDPWLPLEDTTRNVDDQRKDPASTLVFTRDLIALRKQTDDLRVGAYAELATPEGVWAWRRGVSTMVVVNLGSRSEEVEDVEGVIVLTTGRDREGDRVSGRLRVDPGEGVVVVSD